MHVFKKMNKIVCICIAFSFSFNVIFGNESPTFTYDLNNLVIPENTKVGSIIETLKGVDPEGTELHYGIEGTDLLSVDRNSGDVKLVKPLDREVNDSLRFDVLLEDQVNDENGAENNVVRLPISIIIDDVNDNPPKFLQTPYEISVNEDTKIGTTIFKDIKVEDTDLIGEPLDVVCEELEFQDSCQKFEIIIFNNSERYFEGGLVLKENLDYNDKQSFSLKLIARDGKFNTSTACDVRVIDIQNLSPTFQSSLTAIVQEDSPIGTLVMTLQAKDGDRGTPRTIIYDLQTNPLDYFLLDGSTGELRTAKPLDREILADTNGVLSLSVRARELVDGITSDESDASTTAVVSITIRDVNDEAPKFNKKEYYVRIPENLPEGSPLPNLDMIVTDTDIGNNSAYSLRVEDLSGVFAVEPTFAVGPTSVIIRLVNSSLDYENPNQRKFILLVIAEETETSSHLSTTATVTVEVTDNNDNGPVFENPTYMATVNESALPGTIVTTITATDRDSGINGESSIVYELIGDGADKFNVNKKTGRITVEFCNAPGTVPCLDYETKPIYFLTYKAVDDEGQGYSTSVPFKIMLTDSNDNPPVFAMQNYTASVDEGATHFEPQLFVNAKDTDKASGNVYYFIPDDNVNHVFEVNNITGEIIIVSDSGILRTNDSDMISFSVVATDGLFSDETFVSVKILDINNNNPRFLSDNYSVDIPEDVEIGKQVVKVIAVDDDSDQNAKLSYRIEKGSFDDFKIDNNTGMIRVTSKLDYDKRNFYNVTVIATDAGTPMLTGTTTVYVRVSNTNDKDPYFDPPLQRTEIPKDANIGSKFYKMIAADPDINGTEALSFSFGEPITAVDKNGKEITGEDVYKDFFAIEEDTGEVYVSNYLQRNVAAVVRLTVIVTDTSAKYEQYGKGTLMVNILDVNDIPPIFSPPWTKENPYYVTEIQEESAIGTLVDTFTASDPDSEIHHYTIEPASEYFEINETTGAIYTKARIDYEQIQSINFTLYAYDIGEPQLFATARVTANVVNVNDMAPVFDAVEYNASVRENSPKDTFVLKVTATDADLGDYGKIKYSFKGDYVNDFVIDVETGDIKVANSAALDRENISEVLLKVEASDMASNDETKSAIVLVRVKIEDVNDNAPIFTQHHYSANIVETIPYSPPSPIVQFHAEDKDDKTRLRYHIVNGNDEEAFHLDFNSGILYPKRSLLGILKQFKLTVEVTDGKFTDKAVVDINVLDVNQNKPFFKEPSSANASVLIPENTDVNYLIMRVFAEDKDPGENGRVTYHFRVGNNDTQSTDEFKIDENSGELRTLRSLDREKKNTYQLILVAKDHGTQTTYETLQFLSIILKDLDDNKPMFDTAKDGSSEYNFTIAENNAVNDLIGKIQANDADEGDNARIYYYIIKGNENSMFKLDRRDGSIYALGALDRERNSSYEFYVKATNSPNYNSAANEIVAKGDPTIAHVRIIVKDENDNTPYFLKKVYHAGINAVANIGEHVAEVEAVDPDEGINGEIDYEIGASFLYKIGSNQSSGSVSPSPFAISSQGKVSTANVVTVYDQGRFELRIVAKEKASPYRESSVNLNIWVYEKQQLVRVILSKPPHEVKITSHKIATELSNATGNIVVVDDVRYHVNAYGQVHHEWCDMYMLMINSDTRTIVTISDVLKVIDDKYDHLKNYYAGFAIENVLPAYTENTDEPFETALAALIALTIVLFVGCASVLVLCCCFRHWILIEPLNMKCDMLITKPIIDDLSTTENPLWIEQKLKLYEEQELTMQVFCEPEANRLPVNTTLERMCSDDTSMIDNTYATIQHPGRRNSVNTMLSMGPGDYATLGGSVLPLDKNNSHNQQMIEAALGFQGCTFQVPDAPADTTELLRARSELRMNKDGEPEIVSELM